MDLKNIFLKPDGPFGLDPGFVSNLGAELLGAIVTALITSLAISRFLSWRERKRWSKVRQSFARGLNRSHLVLLSHFAFLATLAEPSRVDGRRFRTRLSAARNVLEDEIKLFAYAIDGKLAEAVEEYRQTFSYLVGISEDLANGKHVTIRWRMSTNPPDQIFSHLHKCLIRVWDVCQLGRSVPKADRVALATRAQSLDARFSSMIGIEVQPAGYLREGHDMPDPSDLLKPVSGEQQSHALDRDFELVVEALR